MEGGYVFDLVNITGWTPLVLAGPPPCPGQGSGVPHYPGGVSDAGGNPSLACLWNSLRPSCHPLGGLTANLFGLVAASESTQLGKKLSP